MGLDSKGGIAKSENRCDLKILTVNLLLFLVGYLVICLEFSNTERLLLMSALSCLLLLFISILRSFCSGTFLCFVDEKGEQ